MTDVRDLIPTPRQADLGDTPPRRAAAPDVANRDTSTDEPSPGTRGWRRTLRDADPRRIPGPKTPLIVFGLVSLLGQWDDAALGTLLPEIRAELGLSTQVLATVSSAVSLLALSLGIPFGHLADRAKRVVLLRVSIIGTNVASVIQATAPGLGQLVSGRLLAGAGVGMQQPASFSYLADTYPSTSRTRVFGFTFLVAQLGLVAGPAVAGALGEIFGWRVALGSLGLVATGVGALTFLLREPVRGRLDRLEAGASEETAAVEQPPLPLAEAARAAWSVRTVRRIVIATPFLYLKGAASLGLLFLYFADVFVLSAAQRGAIGAAYGVLGMAGLVFAAPLGDRLLAHRPGAFLPIAAAGLTVQALALLVLGVTRNALVAVVVAAPLAALDVVLAPAFFSLLSQVVPARVRGLGLQIATPAQVLGIIAFPVMAGFADQMGLQRGIALFAIPTFIAALILAGGGPGTARDRRTALAAGLAEEAAREALARGDAPVLVVRDLEAGYGPEPVLRGVSLDARAGEVLVILGPNGAGKTTLLNSIAGVRQASSGAVVISGVDATTSPAHVLARRGVALVSGGQAVVSGLTVLEHMAAAAKVSGASEDPASALAARLPALAERSHQQASALSGGEQQQLALACASLAEPALLLIDELSLGLSPQALAGALDSARAQSRRGAAVVVVEQSVDAALAVADRVLILDKGQVVFSGTPDEARADASALAAVALGGARRTASRRSPVTVSTSAPVLSVDQVTVDFGSGPVVSSVSLAVRPGEIVGLIGPNGAGKTTLFDAVSGFVPLSGGVVTLGGVDVTAMAPAERARLGLGRSFQRARLFPGLTVRDAVLVALDRWSAPGAALAPLGVPSAARAEGRLRRRAEGALELLGLDRWAGVPVAELPTGTRRLVALACTLAFEPSAVLLDEPTAGLSRLEAEEVAPLLSRTARDTGAAVLVVEHDVPLLASVADRLVAMVAGSVVADGAPDDVVNHPAVIDAYLGPGVPHRPTPHPTDDPTGPAAGQED